ncbi:Cytochrome c-type biogenesis protein CcmH precursor [Nocardioides dokdonensis FR1436]|uniref:Cytochrome c-type biogenesis protein n=1 Tax=Nocardioides dokdonensis FR1436 TaxID=1300347 RepID=A0A1A9GP52_9ACTN|nr:Cytochrome c-type biogenesis protein CcmH precursor [Nocardioides dokdonensis FR1436]
MVGVLVALAVAGLVRSAGTDGPVSDAERAQAVAASLRCPTCQGLSVADSGSPLARSMRDIIDEQVAAGESNEEITQYFVDRYSGWVLLAPRAGGIGWVVWAVPGAAVLVGLLVVTSLVRRRRDRVPQTLRWVGVGGLLAASLAVLVATNLDGRGEGELATGNVAPLGTQTAVQDDADQSGGVEAADIEGLRATVDADPDDVRARLALASAALQAGRLDVTREQAEAALDREPRNVDALMLRGLGARSADDAGATRALRSFLRLAPADHPGVPLVHRLLEEGS